MADQPTVVVVGSAPNTNEGSETASSDTANEQAQRFGELLEAHRTLREEVMRLQARLASSEATAAEVASLRAEVARLNEMLAEVEEEIEEEVTSDVTVIQAPPPETPPEPEPRATQKPWLERLMFGE